MSLADQIEAGFPPGTSLPAELRRLCEYWEQYGDPSTRIHDAQIGCHELQSANDNLLAWFRGDSAAAGRFAAFGTWPPGCILAFWLHAGPDAATAPVVHLGPDPLNYRVLAADFRAFLHLLGVGYGELGFDDLTIPPEENWLAPSPPVRFREWLLAEFGITPAETGAETVREARARHPDLGAWVRDWRRKAYPDPPEERYRRELRDLMVAGIDFDRLPYPPPKPSPTQDALLCRDLIRVAEHVSDADLRVRAAADGEVRTIMEEVSIDILRCVEEKRPHLLLPTEWAVRMRFAWWYKKTWLGRMWHCLWSRERPPKRRAPGSLI